MTVWPGSEMGARVTQESYRPALSSARRSRASWGGPKLIGVRQAAGPTIGRMPGYEPVDLSAVCNAGGSVLGDEPGDVRLGRVALRGLPFLIGSEPPSAERCFLLPGVPVPVGIGRVGGGGRRGAAPGRR